MHIIFQTHPAAAVTQVVVRIRPPSEREAGEPACLQHTSAETLCLLQHPELVHYTLDHVAGASRWGEITWQVGGRAGSLSCAVTQLANSGPRATIC